MKMTVVSAPSAWLPLAMSAIACVVVIDHLWMTGATREVDEGTGAHLWQLLMAGQLPLIAWCLWKQWSRGPWTALSLLAVQVAGLLVAAAPVALMGL